MAIDFRRELIGARDRSIRALEQLDNYVYANHSDQVSREQDITDIETYAAMRRDIKRTIHDVRCAADRHLKLVDRACGTAFPNATPLLKEPSATEPPSE